MFKSVLNCGLLLLGVVYSIITYGQEGNKKIEVARKKILADPVVSAVQFSNERQTASLIVFRKQVNGYEKNDAASLLARYLTTRTSIDKLDISKQSSLLNNIEVVEFQQYFKGIKVEFGNYRALVKDGNIVLFSGAWYDVPAGLLLNPGLSKESALQKAKAGVNAKKYATDFFREKIREAQDARMVKALEKELADVSPKGELVIIKDFSNKSATVMRLAYKFDIYAVEPMSRAWIYIDAMDGKILCSDAIIKHASPDPPTSVNATVQTRYAGARNIYVKQISGNDPNNGAILISSHPTTEIYIPGTPTWVLADDRRGKGIETYDLNGVGGVPFSTPYFYVQGKSFTDVDNNWSLSEHKRSDPLGNGTGENGIFEAENDDIAWDAHWGAEMVYDYWKLKHNRKSYDDLDSKIKSFVHFGPAYDNAFWNGSAMTYGDGSGPAADGFKALTSLDVCGHEIGHGVCEFTSNLVYERESGAMNEAFSDIWASCVERFAITSVDPTLVNKYRPFYIGEQIGATADLPLRRMDNPKLLSDPDTYGGEFWKDPNCDPPDLLLNDFCGVHTNSGVLNKWFYLITVGSHSGSGPDAVYARADSDDGINDLGNSYNVMGLGFTISEQVAYLTEMMLSPTATYAEARELSINAAIVVSGDACSDVVRTVINAWYAVGVGGAFSSSCISTFGFISQPGVAVNEGNAGSGCTGEYTVKIPVLLPASATATITTTGSATSADYRLGSTILSNITTASKVVDLLVYVKSDAIVESAETIQLLITITNTGSSPVNTSFVLTITDDDIEPVIGSTAISLVAGGNFDGQLDGYNSPEGWTKRVDVVGTNLWGIWGGKLRITGNIGGVLLPPGHYDNNSPTTTIISAPLVNATGLSNIRIRFDFRVQGEMDINSANQESWGVFDYMTLVYSIDGVNYSDLMTLDENFRPFCSALPADGSFDAILPSYFNNKTFYIGFKWFNDTNAGGPESVSIDNIVVEAVPKLLENDLNHNGRENLSPGVDAYFYSIQDGQLLGKVWNNSTKNFGCTNMYVEKTGTAAFNLYQTGTSLHKVADKLVRIETSLINKASTTVKLYFTEQQLTALESATARPRSSFRVYHVNAASYIQAGNSNTDILVPVYAGIPGGGGSFTVSFNDKPNGSYALGCIVSQTGLLRSATGQQDEEETGNLKLGALYPNPGNSDGFINIIAQQSLTVRVEMVNALGELIQVQVVSIPQGNSILKLKLRELAAGIYIIRFRNQRGELLGTRNFVRQ